MDTGETTSARRCQVKSNVRYVGVKAIGGFQMRQATGMNGLKIWEYREEIS